MVSLRRMRQLFAIRIQRAPWPGILLIHEEAGGANGFANIGALRGDVTRSAATLTSMPRVSRTPRQHHHLAVPAGSRNACGLPGHGVLRPENCSG